MDLKMHHRGQDEEPIGSKHTVDFINPLLRVGEMFKGFEVQYQSNAFIADRLHVGNITNDVNTGRIEVRHILFNIALSWKERTVKIRFPSGAGIEDGFLIGKSSDCPSDIIDDRFSQLDPLSLHWALDHLRQNRQEYRCTRLDSIVFQNPLSSFTAHLFSQVGTLD